MIDYPMASFPKQTKLLDLLKSCWILYIDRLTKSVQGNTSLEFVCFSSVPTDSLPWQKQESLPARSLSLVHAIAKYCSAFIYCTVHLNCS